MKNLLKIFGIIIFMSMISLTMLACPHDHDDCDCTNKDCLADECHCHGEDCPHEHDH